MSVEAVCATLVQSVHDAPFQSSAQRIVKANLVMLALVAGFVEPVERATAGEGAISEDLDGGSH